jgi:glutamate-1-semialdehyde 2,1-aminomutase/spore coat polysaccharide biosynthesis protein SpsF
MTIDPHFTVPARSIAESNRLWERANRVVPGGTQTLSKAPSQFVDGVSPKFLHRGRGCRVWDADGNEYIDYPMALGPILLGYDYPAVTEAAIAQIHAGTTFTLMNPAEVELAERLVDIIPCAERVRFAKNGGDATAGAIRAARALTGREHVVATGYHGFHDWYIASTELNAGVAGFNRELIQSVSFNDLAGLEAAFQAHEMAALIMEIPGTEPVTGYLQQASDLAHAHGALFILDEVVTGFRYALGGAQELFGIKPDLACLGKAMSNGFPLSAVVGSAEAMRAFESIFFSTTFGGEAVSLAASLATIDTIQSEPVIEHIWERGAQLRTGIDQMSSGASFGVTMSGNPPRSTLTFSDQTGDPSTVLRGLFLQECHKRGVLFGGPILPTYSHTSDDIAETLRAIADAFEVMERALASGDPAQLLEGRPPGTVFRSHS